MQYPNKISRCELGTDTSVKIHLANLVRLYLMELGDELDDLMEVALRPAGDVCTLVKSWIQKLSTDDYAVMDYAGRTFKVVPLVSGPFEIKMQLERLM